MVPRAEGEGKSTVGTLKRAHSAEHYATVSASLYSKGKRRRVDWGGYRVLMLGAGAGLLVFLLYLRTLTPSIIHYDPQHLKDAAVFQTVAALPGVADYTGYPTYTMVSHLFTYLPFGDEGYRVNVASATYAALAVVLVYLVGWRLTGRMVTAVAGALAFGMGQIFWGQAIIAGVYTLNAFFISLTLLSLLVWRERRQDGYLLLGAFFMGLSLSNHMTSGLLIPAGALFVLLVDRSKLLNPVLLLKGAGCFLLGLLPYLYVPIRTSMDYLPEGFSKWGPRTLEVTPPNTIKGFVNLISGGHWKDKMFVFGPGELPERFGLYVSHLHGADGQFNLALVAVAVLGFIYLLATDRPAAAMLGALFAGWLFFAMQYDIDDVYLYFIPTYLLLALFMAAGFGALIGVAERLAGGHSSRNGALATVGLSLLVLSLPFFGLEGTYLSVDRSQDYQGRQTIEAVAREVDPDAVIFHHRSPLLYMVLVENRREDVELVNYIEDSLGEPALRATVEFRDRPVYHLFPSYESTRYFKGVETMRLRYNLRGYDLVEVDRDVLIYQVVKKY